jgi:hypothetical protein
VRTGADLRSLMDAESREDMLAEEFGEECECFCHERDDDADDE